MTLNASLLASARPPEITLLALCRSGRSPPAAVRPTNFVCVGKVAFEVTLSTWAEPPAPAASNDAMRMVATILLPAATSTVVMALPA